MRHARRQGWRSRRRSGCWAGRGWESCRIGRARRSTSTTPETPRRHDRVPHVAAHLATSQDSQIFARRSAMNGEFTSGAAAQSTGKWRSKVDRPPKYPPCLSSVELETSIGLVRASVECEYPYFRPQFISHAPRHSAATIRIGCDSLHLLDPNSRVNGALLRPAFATRSAACW